MKEYLFMAVLCCLHVSYTGMFYHSKRVKYVLCLYGINGNSYYSSSNMVRQTIIDDALIGSY